MLTGEMPYESGDYFISGDTKIGYLKQDGEFQSENTVIEEVDRIFDRFPKMEQEMERGRAADRIPGNTGYSAAGEVRRHAGRV